MGIVNSLYITPENVQASLAMQYKNKEFMLDDVTELCAQVVLNLMSDVSTMYEFEEIPLEVENSRIKLPCNVFTIHDLYDSNDHDVDYNNRGIYLYNPKDKDGNLIADGTTLYINYAGIPVDDTGNLLIFSNFQFVCETFCKLRMFEEDVLMGKADKQIWMTWQSLLPGQVIAARQTTRHLTKADKTEILIIKGNMIPRIGPMELKHKRREGWSSSINL